MKPIHKLGDTIYFVCDVGQLTKGKVIRYNIHRRHSDYVYHIKYKKKYLNDDGSTCYTTTHLAKRREHLIYKDI